MPTRDHEYFRSDVLAELSAETDLGFDVIAAVLDAITKIGITPEDWQRTGPTSDMSHDPRLAALRRKCRGRHCYDAIFWARTANSMMPVDYAPVDVTVGTIRLVWPKEADPIMLVQPAADIIELLEIRETLYPGERWYKPHWASCPHAHEFRKKTTP